MVTLADSASSTKQDLIAAARSLAANFSSRANSGEIDRQIPLQSVSEMLDAGIARILMPAQYGGYALDFDTEFEVVREISKADASHGWCASLIVHHPHMVTQFPEQARAKVWENGADVAICASLMPALDVKIVESGFRISGHNSSFASGVKHSQWAMLGGIIPTATEAEWAFFLVPASDYSVHDTWFTAGMQGTGSNTIVTEDVFVSNSQVLKLKDLKAGTGSGELANDSYIFSTPFYFHAPLAFVAPMLGAAQGAYEYFHTWTQDRTGPGGVKIAHSPIIQIGMARAAATLDAAELLVKRAVKVADTPSIQTHDLMVRNARDFTRASELIVEAIDELMDLSGTGGFVDSSPIQRAWRDIHLASKHLALKPDRNFTNFSRVVFGMGTDPHDPFLST